MKEKIQKHIQKIKEKHPDYDFDTNVMGVELPADIAEWYFLDPEAFIKACYQLMEANDSPPKNLQKKPKNHPKKKIKNAKKAS